MESAVYELTGPRNLVIRSSTLDLMGLNETQIAGKTLVSVLSPGTELAAYRGDPPLRPGNPYPRLVGYCNVASVLAAGSAVSDLRPGDRVITFQSHRSAFICAASEVVARVPP